MTKQVKPPKKAKKKTDIKENGGKVLINLGQLIFGTVRHGWRCFQALGGVLPTAKLLSLKINMNVDF